ncbi:unnamed protein product [Lymnaea stagnalis]|uniref:MD-2-related lipid-recognition domain-containing protein n=1 Tax=Lymnaea stagnalis TaxID=6523 RepID=A0AAV2HT02_LYMST
MLSQKSLLFFVSLFGLSFSMARTNVKQMVIEEQSELSVDGVDEKDGDAVIKYVETKTYSLPNNELFKIVDLFGDRKFRKSSSALGSFKWQQCDNGTAQIGKLNVLNVSPDPLVIPGVIKLTFDGELSETVDAPLKMAVELKKKLETFWIRIPCIGGIGSCTYEDMCDVLAGAVCPQPFVDNKVPCKCPFTQGHYSIPTSAIDFNVGEVPNGDYYAKIELTYGAKPVYCIELNVTIA